MMNVKPEFAAVCGTFCGTCKFLGESCDGCLIQKGRMFWGICERYQCCVEEKKLEHCGWCEQFPCHWFDWNPEKLDEATFANNRQRAINNLLRRREVGTQVWLEEQADTKIVMIRPTERFDVSWGDEFEAFPVKEENKTNIAHFYHRTSAPLYHHPSGGSIEEALYDIERYFDYHRKNPRYQLFLAASTLVYDKQTQQLVAICLIAGSNTEGHIFNIFVDLSYRRRGLATRMIQKALTVLADEYSLVDLETEAENPARFLYEKLGFVTIGQIE